LGFNWNWLKLFVDWLNLERHEITADEFLAQRMRSKQREIKCIAEGIAERNLVEKDLNAAHFARSAVE
jgi:hypothetical protein